MDPSTLLHVSMSWAPCRDYPIIAHLAIRGPNLFCASTFRSLAGIERRTWLLSEATRNMSGSMPDANSFPGFGGAALSNEIGSYRLVKQSSVPPSLRFSTRPHARRQKTMRLSVTIREGALRLFVVCALCAPHRSGVCGQPSMRAASCLKKSSSGRDP